MGTTLHPRVAIDALCFPGAGLETLAAHWRALAPARISFTGPLLLDRDPALARRIVTQGGYLVETIPHQFCAGALPRDERAWTAPRRTLSRLIGAAQSVGARSIYLLTGGRGVLGWDEAADIFCAMVAPCVAEARAAGIAIGIENALPLHADIHLGLSLRDTVALAERATIGVCVDVFGCWTEPDLDALIERCAQRCIVVQISDYVPGDRALPCRAVPGDGAIPLRAIVARLLAAGYRHGFDLELIGPRIDAEGHLAATGRAARYLGAMLDELGA